MERTETDLIEFCWGFADPLDIRHCLQLAEEATSMMGVTVLAVILLFVVSFGCFKIGLEMR